MKRRLIIFASLLYVVAIMTSQDYRRNKPVPAPRSQISPDNSPRGAVGDSLQPQSGAEFSLLNLQMNDVKAKTVLKEAVDAVVNSFAKHTHGYGRGD